MKRLIKYVLHPAMLAGALALWWLMGQRIDAVLVALGSVRAWTLFVLERLQPAKPDWSHTLPETLALLSAALALIVLSALLTEGYRAVLYPAFAALREGPVGLFGQWPVLVQVPLLYFSLGPHLLLGASRDSSLAPAVADLGTRRAPRLPPPARGELRRHPPAGNLFSGATDDLSGLDLRRQPRGRGRRDRAVGDEHLSGPQQSRYGDARDGSAFHHQQSASATSFRRVRREQQQLRLQRHPLGPPVSAPTARARSAQTGIGPRQPSAWELLVLPIREPARRRHRGPSAQGLTPLGPRVRPSRA